MLRIILTTLALSISSIAMASPGTTDRNGCHKDHCHSHTLERTNGSKYVPIKGTGREYRSNSSSSNRDYSGHPPANLNPFIVPWTILKGAWWVGKKAVNGGVAVYNYATEEEDVITPIKTTTKPVETKNVIVNVDNYPPYFVCNVGLYRKVGVTTYKHGNDLRFHNELDHCSSAYTLSKALKIIKNRK